MSTCGSSFSSLNFISTAVETVSGTCVLLFLTLWLLRIKKHFRSFSFQTYVLTAFTFVCVLVMDSGNKFKKFSFGDNVHAAKGGGTDGDSRDEEDVFASVVGSI